MDLKISSKVEGPEFYYFESHEWKYMDEWGVAWFTDALNELSGAAEKAAKDGKGGLTATLTQQWNDAPVQTQVIYNLSYKDMVKVQKLFVQKYAEIVKISEGKNK
jgi:hypothetical protein